MARIQFSLRKLLLTIAVVVLILSHFLTSYRLWVTNNELQELKRRQGILVIEDDLRAQVLNVDLQEPKTWRWRFYLPEGRQYTFRVETRDIPPDGVLAEDGGSGPLFAGEQELTAKIQLDERGKWKLGIYYQFGRMGFDISEPEANWLNDAHGTSSMTADNQSFASDEPIVLLRVRARDPKTGMVPKKGPSEGILIWIQPE